MSRRWHNNPAPVLDCAGPRLLSDKNAKANAVKSRSIPWLTAAVVVSALLSGCEEEAAPVAEAPPVPVTVAKVEAQDTPVVIEFVGKTASSRRVEIRARLEGFLDKRNYVEGTMVQAGDVLFEMDPLPFEASLKAAKASLAQQQARLENAEVNLKRVEPLAKKKAVAQKDLDDALGTYRSARAAVEEAKAAVVQAELDLGYTDIKTPVTGLSSYAVKREGAYIGIGDSLLTYVAQLDPMWVEFSVSENQILRSRQEVADGLISQPDNGDFEVQIVLADGSLYPHRGRITFADASISEETGTFLLRAEIANSAQLLRPGQFVTAQLIGATRLKAIVVPQRAIQQGAKGSFVWVIDGDNKAEFRPVVTGSWHGDDWFVNSGIKDGETVVVDGALKVRAGAEVSIQQPDDAAAQDNKDTAQQAAGG